MSKLYYITHPDVTIDPAVPVPRWPLSERGKERMRQMLARPWVEHIGSVYCSTEQKAIDGAKILAGHLSLDYTMVKGLDEIDRSSTGYQTHDEHKATMERFHEYPDESALGWETARDAQQRIVKAIETIVERDTSGGDIAIVAHGTVGALYLCHVKGVPITIQERQPGSTGGCTYCFDAQSRSLLHDWRYIEGNKETASDKNLG